MKEAKPVLNTKSKMKASVDEAGSRKKDAGQMARRRWDEMRDKYSSVDVNEGQKTKDKGLVKGREPVDTAWGGETSATKRRDAKKKEECYLELESHKRRLNKGSRRTWEKKKKINWHKESKEMGHDRHVRKRRRRGKRRAVMGKEN